MANPTTAKPSATTYFPDPVTTGGTIGATARCDLPFNTPLYRCSVSNILAKPFGSPTSGTGTGYPPVFNATGFTFGDVSNQPCVTFGAGSTALVVENRGFASLSADRTIWITFRVRMGSSPVQSWYNLWGHGADSGFHGIAINVAANGTITLGVHSGVFTSSTHTITRDKIYTVSVTYVSTGTTRLVNIYNHTDQAFVTPQATGTSFTGGAAGATSYPHAILNSGGSSLTSNSFGCAIFDVYACGLNTATFDPNTNGNFATLIADPCVVSRGTYAGGGAISAAGGVVNASKNATEIQIHANRSTGGTVAGYQFRLHRSPTAGFTPSADTRIGSLQTSPILVDTTAEPNTSYWYRSEQTDGSTTVYSTTASTNYTSVQGRLPKGEVFAVVCGDSRLATPAIQYLGMALRTFGYRAGFINMSLGATSVYSASAAASWQPNTTQDPVNGQASTTLLANAVQAATDAALTDLFIDLGGNDAQSSVAVNTFTSKYEILLNYIDTLGLSAYLGKPWMPPMLTTYEAKWPLWQQYFDVIDSFDNGDTVLVLDDTEREMAELNSGELTNDNLHLVLTQMLGTTWARSFDQLISPSSGGGAGYATGSLRMGM